MNERLIDEVKLEKQIKEKIPNSNSDNDQKMKEKEIILNNGVHEDLNEEKNTKMTQVSI